MKNKRILAIAFALQLGCLYCIAQQPAYKNRSLSPETRAKDLLARMTLDEKLMQMQCLWIQKSKNFK
jgi:beta-glucosidase